MRSKPARPACKLIGAEGNVLSIIGRVQHALRKAGQDDRAREFVESNPNWGPASRCIELYGPVEPDGSH